MLTRSSRLQTPGTVERSLMTAGSLTHVRSACATATNPIR